MQQLDISYIPEIEPFESSLEALPDAGTLAIVSDPWGGRKALRDHAEEYLDERPERVAVDSPLNPPSQIPKGGLAVIEDCHNMYRREIGGFDALRRFIGMISTTETRTITTWNAFAWNYLASSMAIADAFDVIYSVPRLDVEHARTLLQDTFDIEDPETALDTDEEMVPPSVDDTIDRIRWRIRMGYRGSVVKSRLEGLLDDSAGNPEAICRIFHAKRENADEPIRGSLDLTYDESYLLWLLASNEGLDRDRLATLIDGRLETKLSKLSNMGIIRRTDQEIVLDPIAFGPVSNHLERRRLVWT